VFYSRRWWIDAHLCLYIYHVWEAENVFYVACIAALRAKTCCSLVW